MEQRDITLPKMTDNQTWNTCPDCGKNWQDIPAIPGLIHRTRLCDECFRRKRKHGKDLDPTTN